MCLNLRVRYSPTQELQSESIIKSPNANSAVDARSHTELVLHKEQPAGGLTVLKSL